MLEEIDKVVKGAIVFKKGFKIRREFYWKSTKSLEEIFAKTLEKLKEHFIISNVKYGEVWKSFKGGEGVDNNSHHWMTFNAKKKEHNDPIPGIAGQTSKSEEAI